MELLFLITEIRMKRGLTQILFLDVFLHGYFSPKLDRLVAKGKNKKLAVIAVANKLLKQVFGVVRTGTLFDRNYYENLA